MTNSPPASPPKPGVCTPHPSARPSDAAGCCGGPPAADASACCALDEAQKAAGQAGCGCARAAAPGAMSPS
jgi:hypothetical protein